MVAALFASQSGTNCCGPLTIGPFEKSGVQDGVIAALEPERVLVGRAAPELGDRSTVIRAVLLHRGEDTGGLRLSDRLAVERDVDRRGSTEHLAVVVDRVPAGRCEQLLDRGCGAVVERRLDDHLGAGRQACLGLCLLLGRVVEGVVDRRRHFGLLEGRGERGRIELHPANRRLRVRQQDADLNVRGVLGCGASDGNDGRSRDEQQTRRPKNVSPHVLLLRLRIEGLSVIAGSSPSAVHFPSRSTLGRRGYCENLSQMPLGVKSRPFPRGSVRGAFSTTLIRPPLLLPFHRAARPGRLSGVDRYRRSRAREHRAPRHAHPAHLP